MSKYTKELLQYAKASAIFEYAVNNYLRDKQNQQLREEVVANYRYLLDTAFPKIETLYKNNPDNLNAIDVYEIAYRDLMQMQILFNRLEFVKD